MGSQEEEKKRKEAAAKAGGGAGGDDGGLKELEKKLMPLVKKGDGLLADGDVTGALALYQEAMDGFRGAGFKRPKLKEKLDAAKAALEAPEPES
eukprot:SAG22_NODE_3445_length_1707_cov_1.128731_2_plen_94_part_00